ncbi:YbhB/YbcL family Raf kinase inhibitor-like protein [Sphingomonas sp.]|uniref:YbhB/YbcL family Raf kinase inhibitor-like protein n=1 Tax=Sphingomonas sp. TaxID=28214 RepID=UPI0025EC05E0|nr:YbhB/YbcL family Raf kinase inhibitor-like protein [Sphingomonas sp.]MBV9528278.1 YbhB/YbcL family Raf kinase inhibitor-like protein [Sphingomonas sp.]
MLEKIPHWLGQALVNVRAGHDKLMIATLDLDGVESLSLSSTAFAPGGRLPERFTADGEGVSPPLAWGGLPSGARSLALIVEDPDAPTPQPMVHAIVIDIDPALGGLAEGTIRPDGMGGPDKNVGKNSGLSESWLPPDPPTGHGSHDYVFQLLALGPGQGSQDASPGRGGFKDYIAGRVLAAAALVGTYSRGEEADVGLSEPVATVAPA